MRNPFRDLLPPSEPVRASGQAELGITTGPLAGLAEMLALFSPALSLWLFFSLDGWQARTLGVVLPPLIMILLARFPLRRWRRPREWIGVTDRRLLRWRRTATLRGEPRIEEVPLDGILGVELRRERWDEAHGTHLVVLHRERGEQNMGRLHNAEAVRDAIVATVGGRAAAPVQSAPPAVAVAPPPDFRG